MAGELQETTRVYRAQRRPHRARMDRARRGAPGRARVGRAALGSRRGEVTAYENVSLFGLVLVARRKVSFGKLDPQRARAIFIESALVAGEFDSPHPFWAHNRALIREVEDLEHRARRPDVLVEDRALVDFYSRQLPDDVRDARSFEAWYRAAVEKQPKLLHLARTDLMRHGAESVTEELFPRQVKMGEATFPLAYRFEPGHPLDGVHHERAAGPAQPGGRRDGRLARPRDDPRQGRVDDEGAAEEDPDAARAGARARDALSRAGAGRRRHGEETRCEPMRAVLPASASTTTSGRRTRRPSTCA
jgi:HrpA-like RNA helicase